MISDCRLPIDCLMESIQYGLFHLKAAVGSRQSAIGNQQSAIGNRKLEEMKCQ